MVKGGRSAMDRPPLVIYFFLVLPFPRFGVWVNAELATDFVGFGVVGLRSSLPASLGVTRLIVWP